MQFPDPLLRGKLVRRYKRFLSDIVLDGSQNQIVARQVVAHCANSGSMMGLAEPGSEVWLSPARNPNRKLAYTWELVRVGRTLVGVNPALANRLGEEAIMDGRIAPLAGYATLKREVRYGDNSRIDILLEDPIKGRAYVEIKSVTLRRGRHRVAEFPDAVTARGAKHLRELARVAAAGHRAVMLYVVQRGDCDTFRLAADIDPLYASGLDEARDAGVETYCYAAHVTKLGIDIAEPLSMSE